MASDRYGSMGVEIKHVVTFVLNSSNALEFKSTHKERRNEENFTIKIELSSETAKERRDVCCLNNYF